MLHNVEKFIYRDAENILKIRDTKVEGNRNFELLRGQKLTLFDAIHWYVQSYQTIASIPIDQTSK